MTICATGHRVSIPQAVSTVATGIKVEVGDEHLKDVSIPQAVSTVATTKAFLLTNISSVTRFNTASGKHCCNSRVQKASIYAVPKASFGKPQTVNGKFSPHQVLEGLETLVNTGGKPFF